MNNIPTFTMRQLMEAGVHFGHNTRRWNPKMAPYIFGVRNNVHILDLEQTVPMLRRALEVIASTAANNGRVLFVGTKRQAQERVAEAAARCGQYYMNHRWLGGTLTNWGTISASIKRLRDIEARLESEAHVLTKKEQLLLSRDAHKLQRSLGGIREMGGTPDVLIVIDVLKEQLAVKEANKLGIPVVAILDSNADPEGVDYPIPGNDDAIRAINFYCDLFAQAALSGTQSALSASGADLGEAESPSEAIPQGSSDEPASSDAQAVSGTQDGSDK